jgi:hypothetical protein
MFKVGDIVECVENSAVRETLTIGKKYTIARSYYNEYAEEYVVDLTISNNNGYGFFLRRFKLIKPFSIDFNNLNVTNFSKLLLARIRDNAI